MMRLILLTITLMMYGALQAETINGKPVVETKWDTLMPADYSLESIFDTRQFANLDDSDETARLKLKALMEALSSAPTVPEIEGKMIRIPGFVVPLVEEGMAVTEFFLVPYFGACIHTPPPPSNQMIHVVYEPGINVESLYDAVWVSGEMMVSRVANELGTSGYSMEAYKIEPYTYPEN